MRQLLRSLPPRIVSRKWTCQLSSFQTLPIAAAMPPSAMTVCALPRSDLQIERRLEPLAERLDGGAQARAAGADDDDVVVVASRTRSLCHQKDPQVADDAHGHEPDVEVGEPTQNRLIQANMHVALVEPRDRHARGGSAGGA